MSDVNRDPVRWERSMTQHKEGQYVSFHDYALLLYAYDTLRAQLSEAHASLADISATTKACIDRLEAEGYSCKAERNFLWAATNASPVSPAAQADDVARDAHKGFVLMELGIRPQYQIDAAMRDLRLMRQVGANEEACVTAAIEAALIAAQQQKEGK